MEFTLENPDRMDVLTGLARGAPPKSDQKMRTPRSLAVAALGVGWGC